jgi:hypothetical protein
MSYLVLPISVSSRNPEVNSRAAYRLILSHVPVKDLPPRRKGQMVSMYVDVAPEVVFLRPYGVVLSCWPGVTLLRINPGKIIVQR